MNESGVGSVGGAGGFFSLMPKGSRVGEGVGAGGETGGCGSGVAVFFHFLGGEASVSPLVRGGKMPVGGVAIVAG